MLHALLAAPSHDGEHALEHAHAAVKLLHVALVHALQIGPE